MMAHASPPTSSKRSTTNRIRVGVQWWKSKLDRAPPLQQWLHADAHGWREREKKGERHEPHKSKKDERDICSSADLARHPACRPLYWKLPQHSSKLNILWWLFLWAVVLLLSSLWWAGVRLWKLKVMTVSVTVADKAADLCKEFLFIVNVFLCAVFSNNDWEDNLEIVGSLIITWLTDSTKHAAVIHVYLIWVFFSSYLHPRSAATVINGLFICLCNKQIMLRRRSHLQY